MSRQKPGMAPSRMTRVCNWCDPHLGLADKNACGKTALAHVYWESFGGESSFFCEDHIGLVTSGLQYFKFHPIGPDCAMPGAIFYNRENVCRYDESICEIEASSLVETTT